MNVKYPLKIQVHVQEGITKHLVHLKVGLNNKKLEGSKNSLAQ